MKQYKKMRPLKADWHYKRGDIYLVDLNPYRGSEQGGVRPAVVVQNNSGNYHSPVLLVVPLTTKIKKEIYANPLSYQKSLPAGTFHGDL